MLEILLGPGIRHAAAKLQVSPKVAAAAGDSAATARHPYPMVGGPMVGGPAAIAAGDCRQFN